MGQRIKKEKILDLLQPKTDLEKLIIAQPEFRKGLTWGEPRYGHPEGMVLYHIPEVLHNIHTLVPMPDAVMLEKLRLIALIHDTFKYAEDKSSPRDWSKHHGILARRFAERFIQDDEILEILELHDEAYYCWRTICLQYRVEEGEKRWAWLLGRIQPFLQLYYTFFKCDTRTGDKTQAPVKWVERQLKQYASFQPVTFE